MFDILKYVEDLSDTYNAEKVDLNTSTQSKKIASTLSEAGFKCDSPTGVGCTKPSAYLKDINRQAKLATAKNPMAIKNFKNLSNIVKAGKTGLTATGYGLLGEIAFAGPFALMDYNEGLSFKRILGNATLNLLGQSEEAEIKTFPGGQRAVAAETFEKRGQTLADVYKTGEAITTGERMFSPEDLSLYPSQELGAEQRFEESFKEYDVPGGMEKFTKDIEQAKKIREQIQQRNIERALQRKTEPEISPFAAASGGIARLTTTKPPAKGPNSQGLVSLKKYGKQY